MKNRVFSFLIAVMVLCVAPQLYGETRMGVEMFDQVLSQNYIYDTDTLFDFSKNETNHTVVVSPYLEYSPVKKLNAFVLADFSWVHTFETDDDDGDADLSNAFLCYQDNRSVIYAGLQPFSLGRGYIFEDNSPGVSVDLNLAPSSSLGFKAIHVEGSSTLFSLNLGFVPGLFEKIDVFAAAYHDSDDTTASLLDAYYVWETSWETLTIPLSSSKGDMVYAGFSADVFIGDFFVKTTGVVQKGTVTFTGEDGQYSKDIDLSSFLADLEISRNLHENWSASGILLVRSGGKSDSDKAESHAFITPRPMSYRTKVFANDRFGPYTNESGLYSQGIVIPGLVSPALSLSWSPRENLMFKTLGSLLYPYEAQDDNRTFYGWEWDVSFSYSFLKRYELTGEAGYFKHGDFFKDDEGKTPDSSSRVMMGISVSF